MKHLKVVKRVAPYLLIFVMDLMISNEKPTTLFPKVIISSKLMKIIISLIIFAISFLLDKNSL